MRRLGSATLAGLVAVLLTAGPAHAVGTHLLFHHSHKYQAVPAVPLVPAVPVVPLAPSGPVQPITPGDVIMVLKLINGVWTWVHELRAGGTAPAPNPGTTTAVEAKVSPEVFKSIAASDATLKSAVDKTNALLKAVRENDKRFDDKNLPDVKPTQPGAAPVGGMTSGGVEGTIPVPKPK